MFLLSVRVCRIPYELLAILILMGTMHETLQKREEATREPGRLSGDGMYRVHHCSGLYPRINRNTPPVASFKLLTQDRSVAQKGLLQNSSLKKSCTKPGTFSRPKRLKKGSGFLILRYFFVQVAIAFLFCNSPFHCSASLRKPEQRSFGSAQIFASFGVKLAYGVVFTGSSPKEKA